MFHRVIVHKTVVKVRSKRCQTVVDILFPAQDNYIMYFAPDGTLEEIFVDKTPASFLH